MKAPERWTAEDVRRAFACDLEDTMTADDLLAEAEIASNLLTQSSIEGGTVAETVQR